MREFARFAVLLVGILVTVSCGGEDCKAVPWGTQWSGIYQDSDGYGYKLTIDDDARLAVLEFEDVIEGKVRITWRMETKMEAR